MTPLGPLVLRHGTPFVESITHMSTLACQLISFQHHVQHDISPPERGYRWHAVCRRRLSVSLTPYLMAHPLQVCLIPMGLPTPSVGPQIAECQRVLEKSGLEYKVCDRATGELYKRWLTFLSFSKYKSFERRPNANSGYGTNLEGPWDKVMEVRDPYAGKAPNIQGHWGVPQGRSPTWNASHCGGYTDDNAG